MKWQVTLLVTISAQKANNVQKKVDEHGIRYCLSTWYEDIVNNWADNFILLFSITQPVNVQATALSSIGVRQAQTQASQFIVRGKFFKSLGYSLGWS